MSFELMNKRDRDCVILIGSDDSIFNLLLGANSWRFDKLMFTTTRVTWFTHCIVYTKLEQLLN